MGRSPCCDKQGLKKGPWTPEEDRILVDFIHSHGHGSWRSLPRVAGLQRCGKSCRLRWTNYLRPDIKRGPFTADEQKSILQLHGIVGNKWSTIAAQLPGRTDNEIKNYWNTHMKKRLVRMGLDPDTYAPAAAAVPPSAAAAAATRHMAQWESARLEAEARLSRESLLFSACSDQKLQKRDQQDVMLPPKAEPDVFLRMWNSEVGDAFRRSKMSEQQLSSTRHDQSGVSTVSAVDGGHAEDSKSCCCSDSGGSSTAEVETEEAYRMYLDLSGGGGGDDEMSLFHGQFGSYTYSLFAGDVNEESLDAAFE